MNVSLVALSRPAPGEDGFQGICGHDAVVCPVKITSPSMAPANGRLGG